MKIDFTATIDDLKGKPLPIQDGEVDDPETKQKRPVFRDFTLRDVCVNSLLLETRGGDAIDGKEKVRRFRLADKIFGAAESIVLPAEDIVLLKDQVAKAYGALVTARAWDLLELQAPAKK
jgi:hypothetical protein